MTSTVWWFGTIVVFSVFQNRGKCTLSLSTRGQKQSIIQLMAMAIMAKRRKCLGHRPLDIIHANHNWSVLSSAIGSERPTCWLGGPPAMTMTSLTMFRTTRRSSR